MSDPLDLSQQIERLLDLLRQDIGMMFAESSKGKLSAASSRDLVAYLKALKDLKDRQDQELAGLPDDKLEELE
jgi:hypothetical protein